MSVQSSRVAGAEIWSDWGNRVVNRIYPLRQMLGISDHSAVFLTEHKAGNLPRAAIKIVPADRVQPEDQLARWSMAARLSHPHLLRIFDVGRCRLRGQWFLFVVMEYAEQTLDQILPKRALSPREVLELLVPTLDVLTFLHRSYVVHGQLRPSNFLVVNDQLKLASDTIRPIGVCANDRAEFSSYDAPELRDSGSAPPGDLWGLGITLVEALTQHTPLWSANRSQTAALLAALPPLFADTVLRCLSRNPADRPTVTHLETRYRAALRVPLTSDPKLLAPAAVAEAAPAPSAPKRHPLISATVGAVVVSLAVLVGLRFFQSRLAAAGVAAAAAPVANPALHPVAVDSNTAVAPGAAAAEPDFAADKAQSAGPSPDSHLPESRPADLPAPAPTASTDVLHEVIPDYPSTIRDTIHGHVKVTVRVLVDPSGNVVGALVESPPSSNYFSQLASDAASEWRFVPADTHRRRVWQLQFQFTREGTTVEADAR
jgi:TonB family protein